MVVLVLGLCVWSGGGKCGVSQAGNEENGPLGLCWGACACMSNVQTDPTQQTQPQQGGESIQTQSSDPHTMASACGASSQAPTTHTRTDIYPAAPRGGKFSIISLICV